MIQVKGQKINIYDTALKIEIKILRCRNEKNPPTMQVYYFYAKKLYWQLISK
jgi:hypothetical protein